MLVHIYIDDVAYEVIEGEYILQICKKLGIYIPHLCSLKGTLPSGQCSLCIVEIDENLALACKVQAKSNMKIVTQSKTLLNIRKNNLLRMLLNHNINCLTCFKAGSCKLQIYASRFGLEPNSPSLATKIFDDVYTPKLQKVNERIFFEKKQCVDCLRCVKFLSCICELPIESTDELGRLQSIDEFVDLLGNIVDLCPTIALSQKNYDLECGLADATKVKTFDVSSVFCSGILVAHHQNKIINISHIKSNWIKDETKFVHHKLRLRENKKNEYDNNINKIVSELNLGSEKKIFMLGDNIDLLSFLYIKYIANSIENVLIMIDDDMVPQYMLQECEFVRQEIAMMDFAIHVGEKHMSDRYFVNNLTGNLRKSVSLKWKDLDEFVNSNAADNKELFASYKFPYLFVYSSFFQEHDVETIEHLITNVKNDYYRNFDHHLTIKIVPRTVGQIYKKYLQSYLPLNEMLAEYNIHDIKNIFIAGDVSNIKNYNNIPVIQHSVFHNDEKLTHMQASHFLENSGFYMNIFGEIINTKKILNSDFKSNQELLFDIMSKLYGEHFADINAEIHDEMRAFCGNIENSSR